MPDDRVAIGVDIGGTKIAVASVDASGKVIGSKRYPTQPEKGSDAIIEAVATAIKEICRTAPAAVGVGLAGQIKEGVVSFAPNLNWHQVPFQEKLQSLLQLPVTVMNDVRAATWGEWKHGAGQGQSDIVCLFIGTGIGGGIVSGGTLLTGVNNCAGELGHMTIMLNGPLCTCGNRGCLEAFAGGWALAKRAHNNATTYQILEAALKGDAPSLRIIDEAVEALIAGCTGIVNGLNPSRLILGGGLGAAIPKLAERVHEGLSQTVLAAALKSFEVVPAQLKNEAGVIGAASYALYERS